MVGVKATVVSEVHRRLIDSWTFIYIFLGFALTIEGTIIQMLNLDAWSYLILYVPIAVFANFVGPVRHCLSPN